MTNAVEDINKLYEKKYNSKVKLPLPPHLPLPNKLSKVRLLTFISRQTPLGWIILPKKIRLLAAATKTYWATAW